VCQVKVEGHYEEVIKNSVRAVEKRRIETQLEDIEDDLMRAEDVVEILKRRRTKTLKQLQDLEGEAEAEAATQVLDLGEDIE